MKFPRIVLLILIASALPLHAQNRTFDLGLDAVWVDTNSSTVFNSSAPNEPFNIRFNSKFGVGADANIFFGNVLSLDLAGSYIKPTAKLSGFAGAVPTLSPKTKMIPLTAILQFHFIPKGFVDPYVGGGAAYVLFGNINNASELGNGISQLHFKNDVGLALNAGVGIRFSPGIGIVADGKYVPVKSSTTAVFTTGPNASTRVKINPAIFTAGLVFHF